MPIFTSISENKEEIEKAYTAKIKALGPAKANLTKEINKIKKGDSSDEEKLEKQRQKLEIESGIIRRKRDSIKKGKTGKGLNLNPIIQILEVILGEIKAGNNSKELKEMGISIMNYLFRNKSINENQYERMYNHIK